MKFSKSIFWIAVICCILMPELAEAQIRPERILDRAKQRVERNVERRVEKRTDKAVDKALDDAEDAIDGKGKPADEIPTKPTPTPKTEQGSVQSSAGTQPVDLPKTQSNETAVSATPQLNWSQFDFVPGDIVIFEDNLEGERNGEFPSKWDLANGTIENAFFDGGNVILFSSAHCR